MGWKAATGWSSLAQKLRYRVASSNPRQVRGLKYGLYSIEEDLFNECGKSSFQNAII